MSPHAKRAERGKGHGYKNRSHLLTPPSPHHRAVFFIAAPSTMSHAHRDSMYADTVVDEAHAYPSGSVKSQLSTWHADSSKGFLWNMIPKWHNPPTGEGPTTKNPFKLLAMVGPMGWLYFFSGESEMSEEGETGHNFFISRPFSLVFGSFSSFSSLFSF